MKWKDYYKNTTYLLKENNESIRTLIELSGIRVCACANFRDSCWLNFSPNINNNVHGVGCPDIEVKTQKEVLDRFMKNPPSNLKICKNVTEFITKIKEFQRENEVNKGRD